MSLLLFAAASHALGMLDGTLHEDLEDLGIEISPPELSDIICSVCTASSLAKEELAREEREGLTYFFKSMMCVNSNLREYVEELALIEFILIVRYVRIKQSNEPKMLSILFNQLCREMQRALAWNHMPPSLNPDNIIDGILNGALSEFVSLEDLQNAQDIPHP